MIDQHPGALLAEFTHHYPGIELGRVVQDWPPSAVLALIEWLPDDGPYVAARRGGRRFLGWGTDRSIMADLWDLTMAVGMAGSKKRAPRYPRPESTRRQRTWRDMVAEVRAAQQAIYDKEAG